LKDMIKQIVEADAEAKAFDEENQKNKEALAKEIDAQAKVIYDSYMSKADETIERQSAYIDKDIRHQWQDTRQKHKSVLIKLKSDFEANADKWSDELLNELSDNYPFIKHIILKEVRKLCLPLRLRCLQKQEQSLVKDLPKRTTTVCLTQTVLQK
jgi:DNA polymerase II small subunit/DNA polymerase delta subunit B